MRKIEDEDSLISMQLPVGDPLCNIFNTESMVFHDHRLLFAARCCLLSLELKREAFDDEHEVRSRRESAPRNKLRERLKISLMKIARGERLEVSLISP